MPVRRSPVLTPESLAARQANAQQSTGPRSKARSKEGRSAWPRTCPGFRCV